MTPADLVTDDVVERFAADGVVLLRQAIDNAWIDALLEGLAANIATPSDRGRVWSQDDDGHVSMYDSQVWREIPQYRDFVENSPTAELAGRVMNVSRVNFFFDAIFVRTPGTQFRTPFHQDEPVWSVEGFDACSAWLPLVPVEKASALEYVRGSHRWEGSFRQANFGALTGDERDQVVYDAADERNLLPDIEAERERFDIISWDMEPGDCVLFNARTVHGGSGNLRPDRDLKVFNTKWLGDDVRVCFRPEGMDPDHSDVMTQVGLHPGDRIGTDLYPELWRR